MKRALFSIVTLAALGGAWFAWTRHARATEGVPTITVHAASFERRVHATGNLRAVTATAITVPEIEGVWGAKMIAWIAPDGVPIGAGDVVARFDRVAAEKQLLEAKADLAAADARLAEQKLRAAASAAEKDAALASAARAAAQAHQFQALDPQLYSRNQIIEGDLDEKLAQAQLVQAQRARATDRVVSRSDVELTEIARKRSALAVDHAATALANLEIKAPHAGLLVLERDEHGEVRKVGARMWATQQVAELPALDHMEAELFVLEVDGSGLDAGQRAEVIVDSQPERVFHGTVRVVDKLAKPRDSWVPVQYFSVVVALDTMDPAIMKLGQRVHGTLVLERSEHAITLPRQCVFDHDGKPIVYRRSGGSFAPVAVEVGPATAGLVTITSGLADGDEIAQREPGVSP